MFIGVCCMVAFDNTLTQDTRRILRKALVAGLIACVAIACTIDVALMSHFAAGLIGYIAFVDICISSHAIESRTL